MARRTPAGTSKPDDRANATSGEFPTTPVAGADISAALTMIQREHAAVLDAADPVAWSAAADRIRSAARVFTVGTGRSGLALQMLAMRLMHLGLDAHVVGETTTPAIGEGDVLIAASGSGGTARVVRAAETATKNGAQVVAITTAPGSDLAALAAEVLVVAAADKQDFDGDASDQYAGSLFEQSVLILGDGLFHSLWSTAGDSARELWRNHANLE